MMRRRIAAILVAVVAHIILIGCVTLYGVKFGFWGGANAALVLPPFVVSAVASASLRIGLLDSVLLSIPAAILFMLAISALGYSNPRLIGIGLFVPIAAAFGNRFTAMLQPEKVQR
jgi:hypothetical protein